MGCGLNKDGLVSSLPHLYPTHCMLVMSNKNKYQIGTSPLVMEEQHRADSWWAWETAVSTGCVCVCECVCVFAQGKLWQLKRNFFQPNLSSMFLPELGFEFWFHSLLAWWPTL